MNKHRRKQIHEIADSLSQLKTQIDALYGEESAAFIKIQKSMRMTAKRKQKPGTICG